VVKSVFRYFLIASVLVLVFGFGVKAFSNTLQDAYNILIGNGWTVKDALGFLGTSIAGTIAMNPGLAPAVAAGALSAYIGYKGAQLYDIYREWKNVKAGIAMLNPVEYSQSMSVKILRRGEYAWQHFYVRLARESQNTWSWGLEYVEWYNNNGNKEWVDSNFGTSGRSSKETIIERFNYYLTNYVAYFKDAEGKAMFNALVNTAYNYLVADTDYAVSYSRDVYVALEGGSTGVNASTLGYRVNVDPQNISEDGVQYLNNPDAFYQWFVTNYMNGINQGTFVTPTTETYDEIRSELQAIINQLNTLSSAGGVSEETLNQLKTEILTAIDSKVSAIDTTLTGVDNKVSAIDTTLTGVDNKVSAIDTTLTGVDNKVSAIDTTLTGIDNKVSAIDTTLSGIKTAVDDLTTTIDEAQEEERGYWDRLMEWLDETLFEKLRELLEVLFVPDADLVQEICNIEVPEYEKSFSAEVSFSSENTSMPISLFGARVDLAGYIAMYAAGLKIFMNIFVSSLASIFVIRAFKVHLNID